MQGLDHHQPQHRSHPHYSRVMARMDVSEHNCLLSVGNRDTSQSFLIDTGSETNGTNPSFLGKRFSVSMIPRPCSTPNLPAQKETPPSQDSKSSADQFRT